MVAFCGIYLQSARADLTEDVVYGFSGTLSTNGGGEINVPKFNPKLGELQFFDVAVDTLDSVSGTATFDIPGCPGCPIHFHSQLFISGSTGVVGESTQTEVEGIGGDTEKIEILPWSLDLPTGAFFDGLPDPSFIGTGTYSLFFPINISCDPSCDPTSGFTPYLTAFTMTPSVGFTGQVDYTYTPAAVVPEPRLLFPTALLLLGAVAFMSHRHRAA